MKIKRECFVKCFGWLALALPYLIFEAFKLIGMSPFSAPLQQVASAQQLALATGSFSLECAARRVSEDPNSDCISAKLYYVNSMLDETTRLRLHCGFDGWNKTDSLRNFRADGQFGNVNYFFEEDMIRSLPPSA